jgi:hypothetical protein
MGIGDAGNVPVKPAKKQTLALEKAPAPLIVTVTLVEAPGASGGIVIEPGVMVMPPPEEKLTPVAVKSERFFRVNV